MINDYVCVPILLFLKGTVVLLIKQEAVLYVHYFISLPDICFTLTFPSLSSEEACSVLLPVLVRLRYEVMYI